MKKISFKDQEKIVIATLAVFCLLSFFLDGFFLNLSSAIQNSFLDSVLFAFSLNISFFLPLLLATSLYIYFRKKKKGIFPLWISFGAALALVFAMKLFFARPRPLGLEMTSDFLSLPDYSFPSAHAALSFAILAVIDEKFKEIKLAWLAVALLTVTSRVYFSFHYFSDVCFGALFGYLLGICIVRVLD